MLRRTWHSSQLFGVHPSFTQTCFARSLSTLPKSSDSRLGGKVAIITGGGAGIGRESCLLFARKGASVVVADLDGNAGEETKELILKENADARVEFCAVDVSQDNSWDTLVRRTTDTFGKIDILFNNAGIMNSNDGGVETEQDVWDLTMNVNAKGVFLGCKHAIPSMVSSGGGSIINVASFVAMLGAATPQIAYTASKGAVLSLTRELAVLHARDNIRVNSLCPGPLKTELLMKFLDTEEKKQRRLVHIPMGRFGEAREIAMGALFLASDESSYVTGSTFLVDGGITAAYVTPE